MSQNKLKLIKPKNWQDYLLEASYYDMDKSRILINDFIYIVYHDNIKDFIQEYSFDAYRQIFDKLSEMEANNLIEKE